jgi:hypothetical protein
MGDQREGWDCPLLKRWIEEGYCLDINYQRLGLFTADLLTRVQKETRLSVPSISAVCEACPNLPLRGHQKIQ